MAFSYDPSTSAGKVRLLIPDRTETGHLFEDDEIETFLEMEENVIKRAVALGLETAASNHVLVLKVIKLLDLQTDGRAVSQALLERARLLRQQAASEEENEGGFDIAEMVLDPFSYRERMDKEARRHG